MQLRTAFGTVRLSAWRGKNPVDGCWGCPIREYWRLSPHQQLSPALEDKLAYFATVTGSYPGADAGASSTLGYDTSQTGSQIETACASSAGLKSVTVASGSFYVG